MAALAADVDGFRLAYDEYPGDGAVVALHGWPGDRRDHRALVPLLAGARVVVPDLRGFGDTRGHSADAADHAGPAQVRSVVALVEELGLGSVVLAGYDVGSRVAQAIARERPDVVRALVISPPLPGAGERVLTPAAQREFWYQSFHQLPLVEQLVDGRRDAVRAYLAHFWAHWSGPEYVVDEAELDRLASAYARPGRFAASVNWYRAGAGMVAQSLAEQPPARRIGVPTTVLWPEHDPLFPQAWGDRVAEWFADADVRPLPGVGHFTPLEAPAAFAAAIRERLAPAGT